MKEKRSVILNQNNEWYVILTRIKIKTGSQQGFFLLELLDA